jgi:hypothetical protein
VVLALVAPRPLDLDPTPLPQAAVAVSAAEPRDEALARRLEGDAAEVLAAVSRRLDLPPPPRVTVVVADDVPRTPAEEARLGLRGVPAWAAGVAQPEQARIVLFARRAASYPHTDLRGLLAHEGAHLVLGFNLPPGAAVPRWYHEGLAMVTERDLSLTDAFELARMQIFGAPYPLDALGGGWPLSPAGARRAYAESLSVVSFAEGASYPGAPRRLVSAMRDGLPFPRAFNLAYGMSLESTEYLWRQNARLTYLQAPLLWAGAIIQAGLGLLAIGAYLRARLRRRRRLAAPDAIEGPPIGDLWREGEDGAAGGGSGGPEQTRL